MTLSIDDKKYMLSYVVHILSTNECYRTLYTLCQQMQLLLLYFKTTHSSCLSINVEIICEVLKQICQTVSL